MSVLEVAAVLGQEHRHPGGGVGVDVLRALSPLLHGVVDKDVLVHIIGQSGNLGIGILPQLQNGDLLLRAVGSDEPLGQAVGLLRSEGRPHGHQIEWHRHFHPALFRRNVGHHLMLIVQPGGEAGQIVKDPLIVGVKDMGTVPVDEHTGLVKAVVGVAAHMVPALQHQHLFPAPLGQLPGADGPRHTGADDQAVKWMTHGIRPLSLE